jgi:putative flippase GtrA
MDDELPLRTRFAPPDAETGALLETSLRTEEEADTDPLSSSLPRSDEPNNNDGFSLSSDYNAKKGMRQRRSNSRSLDVLFSVVHCLQRVRIPRSCLPCLPPGEDNNADGAIALCTGLDRVLLGTVPASKSVKICHLKPPQYFWYMVSGTLCDVVQFAIDYGLCHRMFGIQDPSVCWALSFSLSISARHSSHRYFVFGSYVGGYWNSLGRMYAGYSIIIVISTIFNIIMTKVALIDHYVAWVITLLWTGIVNYFILKKLWSFGDTDADKKSIKDNPSTHASGPAVIDL